jgi:drug/metabolite transporter (DMT)-like permease
MTGEPEQPARPDRVTLLAFATFVTLAGGNVIAIRYISCETCELEPFWAAGSRFVLAAVVLSVVVLVTRVGVPRQRALVGAVLYGVLGFAAPFGLAYWGFQRVSAGSGAILLATIPLLTFLFALAHHQERFRWDGLVGGLLAIAGITVIFQEGMQTGIPVTPFLALVAGAACFAETNIVVKAFPRVHPAAMNAVGLAVGGGILLAVSAIVGEVHAVPHLARTWVSQGYLVVLGSVVVFSLYVFVLGRWTASAVSYEGVLIPIVAIVLAWWLQDERITWTFAGGSVLVLAGVYVGALRRIGRHGLTARSADRG